MFEIRHNIKLSLFITVKNDENGSNFTKKQQLFQISCAIHIRVWSLHIRCAGVMSVRVDRS